MFKSKRIAAVVPCFNEETQIERVIRTMPATVDHIVIVDDKSTDRTAEVVRRFAATDPRITLIQHERNQGVGGAIASGYEWSRDHAVDIAVVMAGDGQMDPVDLETLLEPVASGAFDYAKGNRLRYPGAYDAIPKKRFFGNQVLSFLTKIASGYWKITDAQNGYTAINRRALRAVDWSKMYRRYGQPNDLLVRLNIANMRVCDCVMKPVYGLGEKSKMKIKKVIMTMPFLLTKLFFQRIYFCYLVHDFNIIAPLYLFSFLNFVTCAVFFVRTILLYSLRSMPEISLLISLFTFQMATLLLVLAMYFDIQENDHLQDRFYFDHDASA